MNNGKKSEENNKKAACKEKLADAKEKLVEVETELDALKKKAAERDEYYDKYMRTLAEFDNARRRMEKESAEFRKFANDVIMGELMPILDTFDSAMLMIEKSEKDKAVLDGFKMIQAKFHKVLEDNGLSLMQTVGEKFDPIRHEAVMKVDSDKYPEGMVAEELRKGYMLNGKVLRPAMVKVSSGVNKEDKQ